MAINHLATIAAPKTLRVERKGGEKWIARARPGAHPLHRSLTLNYILKNVLKHAISTQEVKEIPLENNSLALLSGGKHIGKLATIKDIIKVKNLEKPKVVVDIDGKEYIKLMIYSFAVGKNKPEVSVGEKE